MKTKGYKRTFNSLRKYRKARGLKQKDVAKILGLKSASIISRWENGLSLPNLVNVFKLAVLYRTMPDFLFINLRRLLKEEVLKAEKSILQTKNQDQNAHSFE